ncbi:heavy-metal-associated domain-containing protein [Nesterenkonia salmonea]|uniref:heavy-metal-associated domain-containing protein n=1 Tax=Nesterenkonia salmonea TaxID=1804987 RepID=UPI001AA01604|nr:heavy-metal-associated domain-containing protein [Nesterenkonia salmonea]
MNAPARLGLYGLILVVVFTVSGFTASAVIDDDTVQSWAEETPEVHQKPGSDDGSVSACAAELGLAQAHNGYQLTEMSAPDQAGAQSELSWVVTGPDGQPATGFELDHEQEMHLIVVRSDGEHFRHVHPEHDGAGTWSMPWEWEAAGTYRVFAGFVPEGTNEGMTLSTTVHVAGDYDPVPVDQRVTETTVDSFDVEVEGGLVAGEGSELIITITRNGEPVTALEPYLGAFGHLVALRDGDLAYLHIHPHGNIPEDGETSGPEIIFEAHAPTPGRYLLFLDFQIEGQVHTAPLVIDAVTQAGRGTGDEQDGEGEVHDH